MYYRSLNAYLRETFGCKVYKLALSAGCTCPNRDGTIGTRGCIFCSRAAENSPRPLPSLSRSSWRRPSVCVAAKAGPDARYIAYFQDFTNTYGPGGGPASRCLRPRSDSRRSARSPSPRGRTVCRRRSYRCWLQLPVGKARLGRARAADHPCIDGRLYPPRLSPFRSMTRRCGRCTRAASSVITHQILGLPGETPEMMVETARYIGRSGAEGIKLHLLHVLTRDGSGCGLRSGRSSRR